MTTATPGAKHVESLLDSCTFEDRVGDAADQIVADLDAVEFDEVGLDIADIARSTSRLVSRAISPPLPAISSGVRAPASSSSINSSESPPRSESASLNAHTFELVQIITQKQAILSGQPPLENPEPNQP